MSELGKFSPQHCGGLDAGDTDSVVLTPENHGPHRMNRKQTANVSKNAYKVPQLLFLTRQSRSNSYLNPFAFTNCLCIGLAVFAFKALKIPCLFAFSGGKTQKCKYYY